MVLFITPCGSVEISTNPACHKNLKRVSMETVKIAPDRKHFILHLSGDRYIPWGHNYASVDIMERLANDLHVSKGNSMR